MTELTAGEVWKLREELERDAAAVLGQLLFTFSRLDANVGLMVASILRVAGKAEQASKVDQLTFHKRLEFLDEYLRNTPELLPQALQEMKAWLADAHLARVLRNELVHGRWGVDPHRKKVLNVVGLPSSDTQRTTEYTVNELASVVERVAALQGRLAAVRRRWHLP